MSFLKTDKLDDVFHTELCDILNAEKQLTKALPKMAENASSPQLAAGFTTHLAETEGQIVRLERIHEMLDLKIVNQKCDAMLHRRRPRPRCRHDRRRAEGRTL